MTLVAFDFDGTLSDDEMIVALAEAAGVADQVAAVTEQAMRGELSYAESLRERASLLAGLSTEAAAAAYDGTTLRPDAPRLLDGLQDAGATTAILTGGFEPGVEAALDEAGVSVDAVVANRLPTADGALTGAVEGPLIEGTKDEALRTVAAEAGVDPDDAIAVGDGANDRPMLEAAGLEIGFRPKPGVGKACDTTVTSMTELQETLERGGVL
ncbi:MAG: phosphoserine phosphatase SerB [Halobacteriaceae archaeon]